MLPCAWFGNAESRERKFESGRKKLLLSVYYRSNRCSYLKMILIINGDDNILQHGKMAVLFILPLRLFYFQQCALTLFSFFILQVYYIILTGRNI